MRILFILFITATLTRNLSNAAQKTIHLFDLPHEILSTIALYHMTNEHDLLKQKNAIKDIASLKSTCRHFYHFFSENNEKFTGLLKTINNNIRNRLFLASINTNCRWLMYALFSSGQCTEAKTDFPSKEPALHYAIAQKNAYWVYMLIKNGADINAINQASQTALHYAATNNYLNIAKLLIENGADINKTTSYGDTPLHRAAKHNNKKIVRLLLQHGANVSIQNTDHYTPVQLAAQKNYSSIVNMLQNSS